ncbi:MAG TPA: carboxypeptidase-like regulatory domain-containing protein [Candidatus Acidoferrales bacterium]|nr:carboxypeptidase-like regulatory domain-containing protein [Candidatus Acidoferrales bacterium]
MRRVLGLCLLVVTSGLILCAQDITGSIGGMILDPSGAAVPNAKITITNSDRNQVVRTINTDSTGSYSVAVHPGGHLRD